MWKDFPRSIYPPVWLTDIKFGRIVNMDKIYICMYNVKPGSVFNATYEGFALMNIWFIHWWILSKKTRWHLTFMWWNIFILKIRG